MKIGVLINDITCAGGTERITSTLTDVFNNKGCEVTIVSCFRSSDQPHFSFNTNIKICYVNRRANYGGKAVRIIDYIGLIRKVRKIIRSEKFDFLLCQSFPMAFIGYLACKGSKTRVIACEHTSFEYYSPLVRKLSTALYKRVSSLVVINKTDYTKYKLSCRRVHYIPNIVETGAVPIVSEFGSVHRIVAAGRLEFHKGFDRLIAAMGKVIREHPETTLSIYGDGTERKKLQSQIEVLGLEKNITLSGTTDSLNEIFADKSIFVLPSRIEGFGLVLVEAASYGLPLVSFDCPNGPRDIISNNNGLLIEDGNIESLSDAIISLIESKDQWIKYHRKSLILAPNYGGEKIYKDWEALFNSLNNKNR